MYFWQIITLLIAAGIAVLSLMQPQNTPRAALLRRLMIWVVPYVLITVGLCSMFLQSPLIGALFLVCAAACFLVFLKRDC